MPVVAGLHDACQRVVLGSVTGSNDVVGPSVEVHTGSVAVAAGWRGRYGVVTGGGERVAATVDLLLAKDHL